jgi:DNA-binding transcriptional ArsR family regulator
MKARSANNEHCRPKGLKQRALLSPIQAGGLAAVFKVLANDTRLRLLHALVRADELCVSDLAHSLGMKPQAVSNQLQRLSDLGILGSRRDGNNIHYRVIDRCVSGLLEQAWCLMDEATERPEVRAGRATGVEAIHCVGRLLPPCSVFNTRPDNCRGQ